MPVPLWLSHSGGCPNISNGLNEKRNSLKRENGIFLFLHKRELIAVHRVPQLTMPMSTIRSLIRSGDLPETQNVYTQLDEIQREEYKAYVVPGIYRSHDFSTRFHSARQHAEGNNCFKKLHSHFLTHMPWADTARGPGYNFMHGLVGRACTGARETVEALARFNVCSLLDMTKITDRALESLTIADIIAHILSTPPRCVVLVHLENNDHDRMYKVMKRLARQEVDLRRGCFHVFCMTENELYLPPGVLRRDHFPGTVDDRVAMLKYLLPRKFNDDDRLRSIGDDLQDYAILGPRIFPNLCTDGTADKLFDSLHFEVAKRNGAASDGPMDDFPAFETAWRRSLSVNLQKQLVPSPEVACSAIHSVLPMGVSQAEAIRCFQDALPPDLTPPYVLTVSSKASNDECGAVTITQQTRHIVVHIRCSVDPGIMTDVCRELRAGYRAVVQELSQNKLQVLAHHTKMEEKFSSLQNDINSLRGLLEAGNRKRPRDEESEIRVCTKRTCMNTVSERFANGNLKRQCTSCIWTSNMAKKEQKRQKLLST